MASAAYLPLILDAIAESDATTAESRLSFPCEYPPAAPPPTTSAVQLDNNNKASKE
jgi:hypothetical protein